MLRKLTVKDFKSIPHAELTFGKINLFIGPNGAGKSNILEAIGVVAAALSRGLDTVGLDERGIRLSVPTLFKSAFRNKDLPNSFSMHAVFDHGEYKCSIRAGKRRHNLEFHAEEMIENGKKIYGRGPNGVKIDADPIVNRILRRSDVDPTRSIWEVISPLVDIGDDFRAEIEQFVEYAIFAPQTAIMRGVAVDPRVKEPLGLTGAGLANAVTTMLFEGSSTSKQRARKIVSLCAAPGWTDEIKTGQFDPKIVPSHVKSDGMMLYLRDRYMKTNRNYLSAYDASEGTLYLIFAATLLGHPDAPRTFSLDNVDGTLNAGLVRKLTDLLVEVSCNSGRYETDATKYQIFLTSHHPSSLDSFDIFNEHQKVFVVRRNDADLVKGSTAFEPVVPPENTSKEDWALRSGGQNLSILMLKNLIPGAMA